MAEITDDLREYRYCCEPEKCGEQICCARFDIVVSPVEQQRISDWLAAAAEFCEWLAGCPPADVFENTPHFVFIKKRAGRCLFNYEKNGGYFCALHSAAEKKGKNPYQLKPRGCTVWPLLEDGDRRLSLDKTARCVQRNASAMAPDKNLAALISEIEKLR